MKRTLPRLDTQVPYWDRVAWDKDFTHPLDLEVLKKTVPPTANILDLGCGYGRLVAELVSAGFQNVVGVDTSQEMIRRGRAMYPNLDLRPIRGGVLPFWEEGFDVVLVFSVLTCLPAEEDLRALMTEVRRVLRPGGLVYVSDLVQQRDEQNAARYRRGQERYGVPGVFELPEGVVLRHFSEDQIGDLTASFEPVRRTEFDVVTMNGHPARGFQFLGRKSAG